MITRLLPLLLAALLIAPACDESAARNQTLDRDTEDTAQADGEGDSADRDSSESDTNPGEDTTTTGDTTTGDTGSADTGSGDTGSSDTGSADTGSADTGSADTGSADTGSDTGTGSCDPTQIGGCGTDEYCALSACSDTSGTCEARPTGGCTKEYQPVCGCDGRTYGNDCIRQAAGVSLASQGECPTATCDPSASDSCSGGSFCEVGTCGDSSGTCEPVPTNCTREYFPVCGCDGNTYDNNCMRQAAGISLDHKGECRTTTGCDPSQKGACGNTGDQFCEVATCGDAAGSCQDVPTLCTREYFPVCGCDGTTYSNDCERRRAGVSLDYQGECGVACSARGAQCGSAEFCNLNSCTDNVGFCEDSPTTCTKELVPVCGCDGVTYDNDCLRRLAKITLDYAGRCTQDTACDPSQKGACGTDGFCEKRTCSDSVGACQTLPTVCTRELAPVCGCNGVTYNNDCERQRAGASLDYKGECRADLGCDPASINPCSSRSQFCELQACTDTAGTCQTQPVSCTKELNPVCGCDGVTYNNDCMRQMAGASFAYSGRCK